MTQGKKLELTDEQWAEMGEHALDGCQNGTIAGLMDIPETTISTSKELRRFLWKKRCERKSKKRKEQDKHAVTSPVMSIFQGKNELGQKDKQDVVVDAGQDLKGFLGWLAGRETPQDGRSEAEGHNSPAGNEDIGGMK